MVKLTVLYGQCSALRRRHLWSAEAYPPLGQLRLEVRPRRGPELLRLGYHQLSLEKRKHYLHYLQAMDAREGSV